MVSLGMKLPPPHVRAWYSYAFAAEVYSACGLAIFLPITLEQLAREVGYYAPELVERCVISADSSVSDGVEKVCKAHILGVWVDTASFSMYTKSIAVAIQAICIISVGPLADSPHWRKRLLLTFAYGGSLSAVIFLLFPPTPSTLLPALAALLFIVGNTAYATSVVCNNAFLPILAKEDEDVQQVYQQSRRHGRAAYDTDVSSDRENNAYSRASLDEEARNLLPGVLIPAVRAISTTDLAESDPAQISKTPISPSSRTHYETLLSLTTSRLSSTGTALGFLSGVSVLTLLLIPVLLLEGSTFALRLAIGLSGIWWAIFTIPSWRGLPGGGGDGTSKEDRAIGRAGGLKDAWKRIGRMISPREIRKLPNLYGFLLAWMFLSDGFHTTTYSAILFASSVLSMSAAKIILIGILVQLSAVISSIFVPKIQRHLSEKAEREDRKPITNFKVLLYAVVAGAMIPLYTCVGLILPFGGLRTEGEMYVLAVWFGLVFGPFLSYSRAVYTELIPPGHESTFFSLFAFTDKSASFIGPAAVGLIADLTGNLRYGFIFLLIMLSVPIPLLLGVSVRKGNEQARIWSEGKASDTIVSTGIREGEDEDEEARTERQGLLAAS
ncbi:UMF1 family MFS transporter [Kwoniella heveanensis BCC8398]|uniref:Autophagy-related protein n=1 Tax=Kwoniella heveanensis BCC8398 TaxID=1296120 RepID=A0A1B9GXC7_9TREE|nr:UMF1 family MFS transporter [Kwoniella heveanensis BCC8398]